MKPTVNICDGCCCGRVNKSNLAVPKDELKTLWREQELSKHVNLRVTSCLGPCSRANVTLVSTCLLYTSPSPRDVEESRMPSSA